MDIPQGVVLAFDFGLARTGVAVGNTLTGTARALAIIDSPTNDARWQGIAPLIEEWQPAFLVVGVPRLGDGTPSTLTARCERFARQLGGRYRKKVFTSTKGFPPLKSPAAAIVSTIKRRPSSLSSFSARPVRLQILPA